MREHPGLRLSSWWGYGRWSDPLGLREDEWWDVSVKCLFYAACNRGLAGGTGLGCPVVAGSSRSLRQTAMTWSLRTVRRVRCSDYCRSAESRNISSVRLKWQNVLGKDHSERNERVILSSQLSLLTRLPALRLSGTSVLFPLHHLNANSRAVAHR